jgi:polar amino acid transport system substrate-binding protein
MLRKSLPALVAVIAVLLGFQAGAADMPSVWTDIMAKKKLQVCVIPSYQPYAWKDAGGVWQGFAPEMGRDVAKSLHVEPEFVETTQGTIVLDLQSGKCHTYFAFNATPERALAIDFAGPIYTLGFIFIDRQGWKPAGNRWTDFNDPAVRICYVIGASQEQQIKKFDPKATQMGLAKVDDCLLAVQSGRADTYLAATLDGLVTKQKNPQLGDLVFPVPPNSLPSYAGIRIDSDGRFQKFLQRWSEYNRANGNVAEWLIGALEKYGVDRSTIPADIQF